MPHGAAANERLRHLIHLDGRHHAGKHILFFERVLQRQRVDDRRQHAHLVGGNAVHFLSLLGHAPKEIPAADDNGDLDPHGLYIREFGSDFVNPKRIHSEALACRQSLPGQLEQNAFEGRTCHRFAIAICHRKTPGEAFPPSHGTIKKGRHRRPEITPSSAPAAG